MSGPGLAIKTRSQPATKSSLRRMLKRAFPFAMATAIWFTPVPAGLTLQAWHLFAVFATAIVSVLLGFFPLLTSTMLAAGAVVLTNTISPLQWSNTVTFNYGSGFRLTEVVDAIGRTNTISYGSTNAADDMYFKIVKVQDVFGRYATFQYDTNSGLAPRRP